MSKAFEATVPADFREKMILYWMEYESHDRETAIHHFDDEDFRKLCDRIAGKTTEFVMDGDSEVECVEMFDLEFVIPVSILDIGDDLTAACDVCSGSGMGYANGATCMTCGGSGEVPA